MVRVTRIGGLMVIPISQTILAEVQIFEGDHALIEVVTPSLLRVILQPILAPAVQPHRQPRRQRRETRR